MKLGLSIFLLVFSLCAMSQQEDKGSVNIIGDERIDTLMSTFIELNEVYPSIEGWRVEDFFEAGNYSKKLAMEAKAEFVEKYPEVPCYVTFQQPYYKVRIGDLRTKMEAEKLLKRIEAEYPNAFVVTDQINFPELK